MKAARGPNHNDVDVLVGEHVVEVAMGGNPELRGERIRPGLLGLAYGNEPSPGDVITSQ